MAEAVGLVASVIAIGQVAGAVGKSAVRLKNLWDQVEEVPGQIGDLLEELQMLEPLLKQIETQLSQNLLPKEVWDDSATKRSRDYCQRAMNGLIESANDLDLEIKKYRQKLSRLGKLGKKIASAKAILKKATIQRHEEKLKRALRLLKMSTDCYSMAMTYELLRNRPAQISTGYELVVKVPHDPTLTKDKVKREEDRKYDSSSSSSEMVVKPPPGRTTWSSTFGYMTYSSSSNGGTYRIRFVLPSWLTRGIWELECRRSYGGWRQISFRVYNTRMDDAKIFKLAGYGFVEGMVEMFDKGEASPFDCDPGGRSLLYFATLYGFVDACKFLLECGLGSRIDEQSEDKSPRSLTLDWNFSCAGVLFSGYNTELLEIQKKIEILDLYWRYDFEKPQRSKARPDWCDDFLPVLQYQGASCYHDLPLRYRLLVVRNKVYGKQWREYHPEALQYLINKDCFISRRDVTESVREGVSLIHSCTMALGSMVGYRPHSQLPDWNEFARSLISSSTIDELHAVEECSIRPGTWTGTPLITLLQGVAIPYRANRRGWDGRYEFALTNWLEQLKLCGIDLVQYGQREKDYLLRHLLETGEGVEVNLEYHSRDGEKRGCLMVLSDLKFGPEPEDWSVIWQPGNRKMEGGNNNYPVEPQPTSGPDPRETDLQNQPSNSRMPGEWVD